MPYLQPVAALFQVIFVFILHLAFTKCKPTNTFGTAIATLTTAAFFRPTQIISKNKKSLAQQTNSTQGSDNPKPTSNTTANENISTSPPDPHQIDIESLSTATSTVHLPPRKGSGNYTTAVDDDDREQHEMSLLPTSTSNVKDDDPLHPSPTTESDAKSAILQENPEPENVSTSCSSTCIDLSFLRTKGGIACFILFELFSIGVYTVLAILVRKNREPLLPTKPKEDGSVQNGLLLLFELFFEQSLLLAFYRAAQTITHFFLII